MGLLGPEYRGLVDAWRADREQRTQMEVGERSARMEKDLDDNMGRRRRMTWNLLPFTREVERDAERERG